MKEWKYIGKLKSGESIFKTEDGELAVEKDFRHLVKPTPEERGEIYRTFEEVTQ